MVSVPTDSLVIASYYPNIGWQADKQVGACEWEEENGEESLYK